MIILRLRGGLGNQLFQYAAGKSLADHHGVPFKLDLYYYKKHPNRSFDLDKFKIPIELATPSEINQFTGSNPLRRFLNKRENYLRCPKVFAQPHYHFYNDWLKLPADLYLSGYFQSEKFFLPISEKLLGWYAPNHPLDTRNAELHGQMKTSDSVSLHIRRGDYTTAQFNSFFGTVPESYYQQAISTLKAKISKPKFFVFSDDIPWCRSNLRIGDEAMFVDWNKGKESYKDLVMMSYCRHNIIANSSFSWWGAWLNQNQNKIVIAPKKWFGQEYYTGNVGVYPSRLYNTDDLIPSRWTKL